MLRIRLLLPLLIALLSAPLSAERLNLGDGLSVELDGELGLAFETVPSYDASKKMLTHRTGDKLHYFISVNRLPRGSSNAGQYFTRLLRDLNAASAEQSVELIEQGQYKSDSGVSGSYIEYAFTPTNSNRAQHQVAHYLTSSGRSYIAIAALIDESAAHRMLPDSISAFRTASISLANSPGPKNPDEARLVGHWWGAEITEDGQTLTAHVELKPDLSFNGNASIDGNIVMEYSGVWSVTDNLLHWDYLYSKPQLLANAKSDTDEIVSVDGKNLVVNSQLSGKQRTLSRQ